MTKDISTCIYMYINIFAIWICWYVSVMFEWSMDKYLQEDVMMFMSLFLIWFNDKSNQIKWQGRGLRVISHFIFIWAPLPSSALLCFPSYEIMLLSTISVLIVISYNISHYAPHSHSASILKQSQFLWSSCTYQVYQ